MIAAAPSAEDLFFESVASQSLQDWNKGKRFKIADDKFLLVTECDNPPSLSKDDIIEFVEVYPRPGVDGQEKTILKFRSSSNEIKYTIERPIEESLKSIKPEDIPMLIDMDLVESAKQKLKGKKLWTRTALWYDDTLAYKAGRKFAPVTVTEVSSGNAFFPLKITFQDEKGLRGNLLMNTGTSGNESRNFGKLFSLTDPKNSYKNISPEVWEAIQNERLMNGMTKEECKLSIGTPNEVETGHNYSNALEIWYYSDGAYLRFIDGILVNFKK